MCEEQLETPSIIKLAETLEIEDIMDSKYDSVRKNDLSKNEIMEH